MKIWLKYFFKDNSIYKENIFGGIRLYVKNTKNVISSKLILCISYFSIEWRKEYKILHRMN